MAGSAFVTFEPSADRLDAVPTGGGLVDLVEQLTREGLISMRAAAELYGRNTHKSTPTRHAQKGVKAPDGRAIKLEAIKVSGSLCTSKAAVLRFFAAQQEAALAEPAPAPTPSARKRAADRAHQELATKLGG